MIELKGLSYYYPETDSPALKDITLAIPQGEFCAVIGRNGAGKSSLCYTLAGIIPHHFRGRIEGTARVADQDIISTTPGELVGTVGLVFQNPFNQISGARFSVRDEIAFSLENLGVSREDIIPRVDAMLDESGLGGLRDRSPFALSGGQQQRLAIASVLVMQPQVLLLDEPTSQLDPHGTRDFFQTLQELVTDRKTTILLASHKLEWIASFADRVILLESGSIVAEGSPLEVLAATTLPENGVEWTQYTRAAAIARQRGLRPDEESLPVTLDAAVNYFR